MKNKINIILLLLAVSIFACEEDEQVFSGPSDLIVSGTHGVEPGDLEEYSLGDILNPESYTWQVEGPAEFVGDASGGKISLDFTKVGDVILTVSNGRDSGKVRISVENVEPEVTTTLNGEGVLRSGMSDTVFFKFDADLLQDPTITIATDSSAFSADGEAFVSGALGDLKKVDDRNYYIIYTAGDGNGTPEGYIPEIFASEIYGADTLDSVYVQLYRVDNIDPIADLSYSKNRVNDSTEVTVTATFSEPITYANPEDSAIYISFSGAGVEVASDTLKATSNPLVYTYDYIVNGEGSGKVNIDISNAVDLAGNALAAINNERELVIDNLTPVLILGNASDDGNFATIQMVSSEKATGWYLILKDGEDAPTTPEEFMELEAFVASGTLELMANDGKKVLELLDSGSYDVYFMVQDEAGNYADITAVDLVMD